MSVLLPSRPPDDLGRLLEADLEVVGRFGDASNATMLLHLGPGRAPDVGSIAELAADTWAVYKPRDGEAPLSDFPTGTLHLREMAAFVVDRALGWSMVPPTVLRDGPMGMGSLQLFVPHDPDRHLFTLVNDEDPPPSTLRQVERMVVFDTIIDNADRKAGHVLAEVGPDGTDRLWLVDHGLGFNAHPHLRTVAWHLAGAPVEVADRADAARLAELLTPGSPLDVTLQDLLSEAERDALRRRTSAVAEAGSVHPSPTGMRPMPWPPI